MKNKINVFMADLSGRQYFILNFPNCLSTLIFVHKKCDFKICEAYSIKYLTMFTKNPIISAKNALQ